MPISFTILEVYYKCLLSPFLKSKDVFKLLSLFLIHEDQTVVIIHNIIDRGQRSNKFELY